MNASGLLIKVKSVGAIGRRTNLASIWLSIREASVASWMVMAISGFFLCGCSSTFMQNVKSVTNEMTSSAPEIGPYDTKPAAYPTPTAPQTPPPQPAATAAQPAPAPAQVAPSPAWPAPPTPVQQGHASEPRP